MPDLSTLSDQDLMSALGQGQKSPIASMSDDDLMKALGHSPNAITAEGIAKQGGVGIAKGTIGLAGMGGDIGNMAIAAGRKLGSIAGVSPETMNKEESFLRGVGQYLPGVSGFLGSTSGDIQKQVEGVTGEFRKPQNRAEQVADTVGQFLPGSLLGPGGTAAKVARFGIAPALASEGAGYMTEGTPIEPYARTAAAIGAAATNPSRLITPNPVSAERQAMVKALENEGVTSLTAGQRTGNKRLQYAEATAADTPLSGSPLAEDINRQQAEQFTRAAMRRVGEDSTSAAPHVVDRAFNRIGGEFDRLSANNHMVGDQQFANDLVSAERDYTSLVPESHRSPIVGNTIRDIGDAIVANGGSLPGESYQALRSRLSRASRSASADPQLSGALHDMTEALDSAMERSIQANNPADAGAFQQARQQYRNMMVIEKAASMKGAAEGQLTPGGLAQATKQVYGRRNYARGQGDFAELARSGEGVLSPLPQSGTGPRQSVMHHLQLAALLGLAGHEAGGLTGTAAGALGGMVVPAISSRYTMNPTVQRYLANQLLQGGNTGGGLQRRLLAAQLAARNNQQQQLPPTAQ